MTALRSGTPPFEFVHREDLHRLPGDAPAYEVNLHGGFAADRRAGFGQLYYGIPGCGLVRIDPDLKTQALVRLPDQLKPLNFHSTKLGQIGGGWRLFLPANDGALVVVVTLEGALDFILPRPEFEQYRAEGVAFAPTDTALHDQQLFVADGYGANYILTADITGQAWRSLFGGKAQDPAQDGKFSTAHGITLHYAQPDRLVIADRPNARLQVHGLDGSFIASHALPPGAWPCGIDFLNWQGRWLGVVGSLVDPVKDRPAPIYILDAATWQVIATIRPKEELGLAAVQHLHNVVWQVHGSQLYLVCQSWNPGSYFVLERVAA